ncbi:hypothetical protein O7599_23205 [Streptomyces sp. WMMC500]|uniref:hypothetical protein n=1 Tax=Streptomyces sp. WMMC500 TaxID=3015154 RepID=UPI00248AF34B|nr:hypothetical protein [Streptomyces sp. WMMC500]WBB58534.1 hypothetical protein O7599_23205 [Streptomyces sp. WMMC500]
MAQHDLEYLAQDEYDIGDKCTGGLDFFKLIFGDPVDEIMKEIGRIAMRGALEIFQGIGNPSTVDADSSETITSEIRWLIIYLAIGSLLFSAAKMALDRRAEAGQTAIKGLLRVVVVSAAATTVIVMFADLMSSYSDYLFAKALSQLLRGINCSGVHPMLLLIIGCLLIIAGIIHTILLYIRLGVMIILMGTLPLAAAASMTEWGGTWWRKHLGWMVAWLLYKPLIGLIFYSGAVMIYSSNEERQEDVQIAGMGVLLLSAIALPALMRVIVPATAALGGDSVGQQTMGVVGGAASGAKSLAEAGGKAATGAIAGGPAGAAAGAAGGAAKAAAGAAAGGAGGGEGGGEGGGSKGGSGGGGPKGGSQGGGSEGGSGGGSGGGGGGGGGSGRQMAAKGVGAGITAAIGVASFVAQRAKGSADVARSGIEGANQDDGR